LTQGGEIPTLRPHAGSLARTAVILTLLAAAFSQARAQSPIPAPPVQGMVVLRNGEVIEGKITRDDGIYIVDITQRSDSHQNRPTSIWFAAIWRKGIGENGAAIQVGNVHDHLDLAQWCMRHNLFGLATVELADATAATLRTDDRRLQHRLKMAMGAAAFQCE